MSKDPILFHSMPIHTDYENESVIMELTAWELSELILAVAFHMYVYKNDLYKTHVPLCGQAFQLSVQTFIMVE